MAGNGLTTFVLMRIFILIGLLFTLLPGKSSGQDHEVIQFSGLVVTGDSLMPVPLTAVYRSSNNRGVTADFNGFFSMPVVAGDTIRFTNIGYAEAEYVIPLSPEESRLAVVKVLERDTLNLPTTYVYPWPTRERFRAAFLALELDDDEIEIGRKNLESLLMYDRMIAMGPDGRENYRIAMDQLAQKAAAQGMAPTTNLLSPLAWARFLQALREGELERQ